MNGTEANRFVSSTAAIVIVITLATIMVLDLFGNTLVLCVLYRQRRKLNMRVANTFLANLSLIDLIIGVVLIPFGLTVIITGRAVLDDVVCQLNGFMHILVGSASIWTMAAISVDRCRAIVSPLGKRLQLHHARWLLSAVWIISFSMAVAPIIIFGKYQHSEKSTQCKSRSKGYLLLLSVICFLIPLAIMTFCYIKVFLKVRKQRIELQDFQTTNSHIKTELKTAKIVFTVLAAFIICWLPFVVVYIISTSERGRNISPAMFLVSGCLTAAHSVCNPIIYFTIAQSYRNEIMELVPSLRRLFPEKRNKMHKTGGQPMQNALQIQVAEAPDPI